MIQMILLLGMLPGVMAPFIVNGQNKRLSPTVQDCLGAIPVCQAVYSTTNSYTGHGNVYPEIHDNSVCPLCMDGEKNDVFYIITVQTNGILRFSLTPNNGNNDYDWSMFNMTNAECGDIYTNATALQVSCNSYGATGYNGPTGISSFLGNNLNCNGPGTASGPPYNKDIIVHAGETYVLNISNWSSTNQSGYTLDFSGSSASIFDNVPPAIDSVQQEISCAGASDLYIRFSENVKCSDVYNHPEKFTLTGPGGPYTITGATSPSCATGATQSPSYTLDISPPLGAGSYTLNIAGDIHDLCDNLALYAGTPFTLTEINAPWATAGNDTTVANGTIVTLHGNAGGGSGVYTYHWEPASLLVNPDVQTPTTINMGASAQFTLTVTDNAGCHGTDEVIVTVIGGVLGVAVTAMPGVLCQGTASQLQAIASGGSGNFTYSWSSNPAGFSSTMPDPTVFPAITTQYHVAVNDGFSNANGSVTVNVNPRPIANPGSDISIPFGTNATLHGEASGGSGNYGFYWTSVPPGYSSSQQSPVFVNLTATTIFMLTTTDQTTGCESEPSEVIVSVTGSPLSCNPAASPSIICHGTTTTLFAMAGGGAGTYSCNWSSIPPGFTSTETNPEVTPDETTSYLLTVTDGFNTATGSVNVQVNPSPEIYLGPADTTVCIYETVILDAGNPGSTYYWNNGSTEETIEAATTGIGYDVQTYSVKVINQYACVDSAMISVIFSFEACTGISETPGEFGFHIWPNPATDLLHVETDQPQASLMITVTGITGVVVLRNHLPGENITARTLDLSTLAPGFYLIRVQSPAFVRSLKFVKL
jgi:hypothetical protein